VDILILDAGRLLSYFMFVLTTYVALIVIQCIYCIMMTLKLCAVIFYNKSTVTS